MLIKPNVMNFILSDTNVILIFAMSFFSRHTMPHHIYVLLIKLFLNQFLCQIIVHNTTLDGENTRIKQFSSSFYDSKFEYLILEFLLINILWTVLGNLLTKRFVDGDSFT